MEKSDKLAIILLFIGLMMIGIAQIINLCLQNVDNITGYIMMCILVMIGIGGLLITNNIKTK